eukprot:s1166_g11.t1
MPPSMDTTYQPPMTASPVDPIIKEIMAETKAQQKLNKIMKAAKKEDNLSPEFQALVHEEQKKDNKECGRHMHAAITALQKAKEDVLEIENSRLQLMSQWRLFLHQSVAKWQEYTSQFQSSETAFQQQLQIAHMNVKKAQKRFDVAKRRADATEDEVQNISDEEGDEMEHVELATDENAQKIQEGLAQVVSSLTVLTESADQLENPAKRQRKEDDGQAPTGEPSTTTPRAMQPFGGAGSA